MRVVADDHAVDPDRVRRVILFRVHPLVQQQQERPLLLDDDRERLPPVGEAVDHFIVEAIGRQQPSELLEIRLFTSDDGAVRTDVLLVDDRLEAACELGRDLALEILEIARIDRPAPLELRPRQRLRRIELVDHRIPSTRNSVSSRRAMSRRTSGHPPSRNTSSGRAAPHPMV